VLVALLGFPGAIVGDNIDYLICTLSGRRLVERFGRDVQLTPTRIDKAESCFTHHDGIIVVPRFSKGLRQVDSIIAGLTSLTWSQFLADTVLGTALWVGVWATVDDLAGAHFDTVYPLVVRYQIAPGEIAVPFGSGSLRRSVFTAIAVTTCRR
jgi:membrane protein DedA with SNARE-associated domain